ncbi:expressed unknown protein [Seminavis robusta]|uniref:Uncharacterized protein n=1 Tax=Seminavis robusta TaxID=568900 RepID=A0A9N8D6C4_9STRA|nr:expressed unknown protein [Seminavis robusta]|eukprot:Sro16_g011630.1 n/a (145) ;mRNA; f:57947-58381
MNRTTTRPTTPADHDDENDIGFWTSTEERAFSPEGVVVMLLVIAATQRDVSFLIYAFQVAVFCALFSVLSKWTTYISSRSKRAPGNRRKQLNKWIDRTALLLCVLCPLNLCWVPQVWVFLYFCRKAKWNGQYYYVFGSGRSKLN